MRQVAAGSLKSPRAEYTKTNVVTNLSNDHELLRLLWTLLTEVCREAEGNRPHALCILEICYGHDIFGKMGDLGDAKPLLMMPIRRLRCSARLLNTKTLWYILDKI